MIWINKEIIHLAHNYLTKLIQETCMRDKYPEVKLPETLEGRPKLLAIWLVSVMIVAFVIALPL